jgi:hypothetical protein
MARRDGEPERLRALVEGRELSATVSRGAIVTIGDRRKRAA